MKKLALTSFVALLAAVILFPAAAVAVPMAADPITISLNNPNQVTAAPSSGITTLIFSGTVVVDSNWTLDFAFTDAAYNSSSTNFLNGIFDSAFQAFFFGGNGTYTGNIFSIDVAAGTLPGLYAYQFMTSNPSLFTLGAHFDEPDCVGEGCFVNGEPPQFTASQAFSVLVSNGATVPEGGSSLLLLGLSVSALCFSRRAFVTGAKPTA